MHIAPAPEKPEAGATVTTGPEFPSERRIQGEGVDLSEKQVIAEGRDVAVGPPARGAGVTMACKHAPSVLGDILIRDGAIPNVILLVLPQPLVEIG